MRKEVEEEFSTIGETTVSEADTVVCSPAELIAGLRQILSLVSDRIVALGHEPYDDDD
jgi:hypothetical protein